jgi:hypothetical protein
MITGLGRVSLLSGQIRQYRVGFGGIGSDSASLCGCTPVDRWAMAPTSWATQAMRAGVAGWAEPGIRPKSLRKLENAVSFSKLFYKL